MYILGTRLIFHCGLPTAYKVWGKVMLFTPVCHPVPRGNVWLKRGVWSRGGGLVRGVPHFSEGVSHFSEGCLPFFRIGFSHFSEGDLPFFRGDPPFFRGVSPIFFSPPSNTGIRSVQTEVSPIFQRGSPIFTGGSPIFQRGVSHFLFPTLQYGNMVSHFSEGDLPLFRGGSPIFQREISHFSEGYLPFFSIGFSHFSEGDLPFFRGVSPIFSSPPSNTGIRSMRGRYASYWNAYLLFQSFSSLQFECLIHLGSMHWRI